MAQNSKSELEKNKMESLLKQDIQDSPHDQELIQPEVVTIDLPDISDIPGQEHVVPPTLGELADTTISSKDEEGSDIFDEQNEEKDLGLVMGNEADISSSERKDLQKSSDTTLTTDENNLQSAALDNTDNEGTSLNEKGFGADLTGKDLDVPGVDEDDASEDIGEEDEENNSYSIDDNENEAVNS